jgi:hypothetical protein
MTEITLHRIAPTGSAGVGNPCAPVPRRVDAAAKLFSLPTTHHPLPTTHYPLLTIHCLLFTLLLTGCTRDIDTVYGQRQGPGAGSSVNGTAVLGEMFEKAGHRVFSWRALSPRLGRRADCIVWFPDDFELPRPKVRQWLENWLDNASDRTLIYVGRDFDAAPWYWRHVLPDAPKQQQQLVRERLAEAQAHYTAGRERLPQSDACGWFAVESAPALPQAEWLKNLATKLSITIRPELRQVKSLEGDAAWLEGIDAAKTDIELHGRLSPSKDAEVLLRSGDDVLVSRKRIGRGRLIVVANGSFLLNLPLVNHEHRKLAGKLIDEIGPPGKTVVFLESRGRRASYRNAERSAHDGAGQPGRDDGKRGRRGNHEPSDPDEGEPPIRGDDPASTVPTGLEIFGIWPTNWILLHLAAVGVIFCFSRWPIFGRPRTCQAASRSDFGHHVDALAELLERTHDRAYAMDRILNYRQRMERE